MHHGLQDCVAPVLHRFSKNKPGKPVALVRLSLVAQILQICTKLQQEALHLVPTQSAYKQSRSVAIRISHLERSRSAKQLRTTYLQSRSCPIKQCTSFALARAPVTSAPRRQRFKLFVAGTTLCFMCIVNLHHTNIACSGFEFSQV